MTRVVLDTNVLASGFAAFRHPASTTARLLRAWRSGRFELIVSERILAELAHTFEDAYFRRRLTPRQIARAQALLRRRATHTPIIVSIRNVATHPEDDLVLATALSAKADYLVTGDAMLQKLKTFQGVTIVSPREFLEVLATQELG